MAIDRATAELQVYNPVLTGIARSYRPAGRIYSDVLVSQTVDKLSGQYIVWEDRDFFSNADDNVVADRSPLPEIVLRWSTDTYQCQDYGLKIGVTPREQQQAQGLGALDRLRATKVEQLMAQMANRREKRLATVLRKSTTAGGQLNLGGAATAAFASSTAIEADWETAKTAVYNKTGLLPNVAVIPYAKAVDMANNTTLRDIFKYFVNSTGFISLDSNQGANGSMILPREFHGTRIIVPYGALAHTGHDSAAKSLSDVWGTSVRFLYLPDGGGAAAGKPATAYSFSHKVLSSDATSSAGAGPVVTTYRTIDPTIEYVCAEECLDERVTAPDAAYELTGT